VLSIGTVLYLASLPFGALSYREYARKDAEAATQAAALQPAAPVPVQSAARPLPPTPTDHVIDPDRPTRLN
jgi:CDP-diacylglycerol--serine O-phosphatidyltransferase